MDTQAKPSIKSLLGDYSYIPKSIQIGVADAIPSVFSHLPSSLCERWLGVYAVRVDHSARRSVTNPIYPKGHPDRQPTRDLRLLTMDWSPWQWYFEAVGLIDQKCADAGHQRRDNSALQAIVDCFQSRDNSPALRYRPDPAAEYDQDTALGNYSEI